MIPKQLAQVDTPAVVINETLALQNIQKYQEYCDEHGFVLRPHIKTHKLPRFAKAQIDAGAIGITCQKVSEAEAMAASGATDIFITYNILGETKLKRLLALSDRLEKLSVVADNETVLKGLSDTFSTAGKTLDVLIECDTGAGRCGVATPQQAADLAILATGLAGLNFLGLMTYPPIGGADNVQKFMQQTIDTLAPLGIECAVISSGGSPDMWTAHQVPITTEYRIGTYIYNDRSLVANGVCTWDDCALTVLATVVSVPADNRAIIDAGSKALTSDLLGLEGYGYVLGHPDLMVKSLSEEHGTIVTAGETPIGLAVGDKIQIIPNHCCVVSNLMDTVTIYQSDENAAVEEDRVVARGCVV
jgi:D-serine deaminase-like pyridoxal phosphate-dependent protein